MEDWNEGSAQRFSDLISKDLLSIAKEEGITTKEGLGQFFGVRGQTIKDWINGAIPNTPRLSKIAAMLGWTLDDLYFYLQTGKSPGSQLEQRIFYAIESLPVYKLEKLLIAGIQRITSEAKRRQ